MAKVHRLPLMTDLELYSGVLSELHNACFWKLTATHLLARSSSIERPCLWYSIHFPKCWAAKPPLRTFNRTGLSTTRRRERGREPRGSWAMGTGRGIGNKAGLLLSDRPQTEMRSFDRPFNEGFPRQWREDGNTKRPQSRLIDSSRRFRWHESRGCREGDESLECTSA